MEVETIGGLKPVLDHCRTLLHSPPENKTWLPYLGETLDAGVATLLAEEAIMAHPLRLRAGAAKDARPRN